jgi:hypothetical protein
VKVESQTSEFDTVIYDAEDEIVKFTNIDFRSCGNEVNMVNMKVEILHSVS